MKEEGSGLARPDLAKQAGRGEVTSHVGAEPGTERQYESRQAGRWEARLCKAIGCVTRPGRVQRGKAGK